MNNSVLLANREKGTIVHASIGSALAIESALGVYPDAPQSPAPLQKGGYQQVWLNLHTLFRNLFSAFKAEDQKQLDPSDLVLALKEDVQTIDFMIHQTFPKVDVIPYLCNYTLLPRKYPNAELKKATTPGQLAYLKMTKEVIELYLKNRPDFAPLFRTSELMIKSSGGPWPKSLIVTHFPVDLLARYEFKQLDLLESHTGTIKRFPQWNSKLGIPKEAQVTIPFNAFTLQVFGDKSTQFAPQIGALRRMIVALAEKDNWSAVTTMDKIKSSIEHTKDPLLIVAAKRFM